MGERVKKLVRERRNRRHWEVIVRDADESRVGEIIPCFDKLTDARAWIQKRLEWLNRNSYTVDVVFYGARKQLKREKP